MTRTTTFTLALLAALAAISPSQAAGASGEVRQTVVSYSDLDLSGQAGANVLIDRLEAASRAVCGGAPFIRDLNAMHDYKVCVKNAMDHAVAAIKAPLVAQIYGQPGLATDQTERKVANRN